MNGSGSTSRQRRVLLTASLLALAATLAGCGFHLRGSGPKPDLPFKTLYVAYPAGSAFGLSLKRAIVESGATTVVDKPNDAEAIATLIGESRDRQVLSLNSQGRVREYTLIERAVFQVKDSKGNALLPQTTSEVRRILNYDESQVLAKEQEAAMMYRDMQMDLIQQVLRRIASIKRKVPPAAEAPAASSAGAAASSASAPASAPAAAAPTGGGNAGSR